MKIINITKIFLSKITIRTNNKNIIYNQLKEFFLVLKLNYNFLVFNKELILTLC